MAKDEILILNKYRWGQERSGGSETHMNEIFSRLSDEYQITLICGRHMGESSPDIDWADIYQPTTDNLPGTLGLLKIYFICSLYAHYYLFKNSPDVVVTIDSPLPWLVLTRKHKIAVFHHLTLRSFFQTHPFPLDWLGYFAECLGIYVKRHDEIIAVSQSTKQSLVKKSVSAENITIVKNGVALPDVERSTECSVPSILFLGGLETYKGADRLPQIHQRAENLFGDQIRLDIAGRTGEVGDAINDYCEQNESAFFHGFVSETVKNELLQKTWILVLPSRVEGYGIVVIEANAFGTPAIGTDVKGLRDSIKDRETGLLVEEDVDEIAQGIVELLEDDQLRSDLSENAREWATTHSWDHSAQVFRDVIKHKFRSDS